MGSEREAKLMAERDALTARLAACVSELEALKQEVGRD
jgi:ABC-type phosphate transport system auxiliary subunit